MNCADVNDMMLDFVEGELADDESTAIRTHIDDCEPCKAKLRDFRGLFGELGAARSLDNRRNRPEASEIPQTPGTHRGQKIIGDFEILDELGRGGMGVVYRARQISLNRVVALKVLAVGAVQSERAVQRFQHEAQAAARLHHTNIVPVYAQGAADGVFFYAMELIDGKALSAVVRESENLSLHNDAPPAEATNQPVTDGDAETVASEVDGDRTVALPEKSLTASAAGVSGAYRSGTLVRLRRGGRKFKRIARLFAEVADGLEHAHQLGIYHRDIKPQNLMLGVDDKLHITDFGLARLANEPGITLSSEIVGTPAYMSPEQVSRSFGEIDQRSDVYSLGVTLYETLTRQRPFVGDTYDQVIGHVLNTIPKSPRKFDSHIPIDLETICLRAMEKEQVRRFQTASAMAEDLRRYAQDFPIASRRLGPFGKTVRWVRRNKPKAVIGVAALLLVTVVPLLLRAMAANDHKSLIEARDILLTNYRHREPALAKAGGVSFLTSVFGANGREVMSVNALADIRSDAEAACTRLQQWVTSHPEDHEALFLLAWATSWSNSTDAATRVADTEKYIARANEISGDHASGPGLFYRGQAQLSTNPEAAAESFRAAIRAYQPKLFPQALLHLGRAVNFLSYLSLSLEYPREAIRIFENLMDLSPNDPYVVYLLSLAHKLYGEIWADQARRDPESSSENLRKADEQFALATTRAEAAKKNHPEAPWGYVALANVLESRGIVATAVAEKLTEFHNAINAWSALTEPLLQMNAELKRDKAAYLMRLYYWVGNYDAARRELAARYADAQEENANQLCYMFLIEQGAGNLAQAQSIVDRALAKFADDRVSQLKIWATARIVGLNVPPLPTGGDKSLAEILQSRDRGQLLIGVLTNKFDYNEVDDRLSELDLSILHNNQLRAAAAYAQAAALVESSRDDARRYILRSARTRDLEDFCFLGQMHAQRFAIDESAADGGNRDADL